MNPIYFFEYLPPELPLGEGSLLGRAAGVEHKVEGDVFPYQLAAVPIEEEKHFKSYNRVIKGAVRRYNQVYLEGTSLSS